MPGIEYRVELQGVNEMRRAMTRAPQVAATELRYAAQGAGRIILQNVEPLTPVFTGRTVNSLYARVVPRVNRIEAQVGADAPHALWVEKGRGPGKQPPPGALDDWCEQKLGDRSLAYVVGRAIGRRGTKGAWMFKRGLERAVPEVTRAYHRALRNFTARIMEIARAR